jgi:UDP-N-acetylglucosamine 3-dehydrogenase
VSALRAGVIGVGEVGTEHARCYARARGVELAGVFDANTARAQQVAVELGARAFPSLTEMLSAVDVVSVAVPQHLHLDSARAAVEHGCHVLMEKPLARTLPEAREIVETCRRGGVKLMLGFTHRFHTELRTARQKIAEGQLGTIGVALDYMSFGAHPLQPWNWSHELAGGGAMIRDGVHGIDRLRWLLGANPVAVCALSTNFAHQGSADVEDGAVAILRFDNGAIASMVQAWPSVPSPVRCDLELYGSKGVVRIKTWQSLEYTDRDCTFVQTRQRENDLQLEVQAFVDSVLDGRDPPIIGEDGLLSLACILAIYRSAEQGRWVEVAELLAEA